MSESRLAFHRKSIGLLSLYTKKFKIKLLLTVIIILVILVTLTLLNKSSKNIDLKTTLNFINTNSQLFNLCISFLLFFITCTYVFLTYRSILLTKKIISNNIAERVYDVKPNVNIELFSFKTKKLDINNPNDDGQNSSRKRHDTYKIEFVLTIHCFGKGPMIFPTLGLTIRADGERYITSIISSKTQYSNDKLPESIKPFEKIPLTISLETDVPDIDHIKNELLEIVLSFKDIIGNSYQHIAFYSCERIDMHYSSYFNLEHEILYCNNRMLYVRDRTYYYQKLAFDF